MKSPVLHKEGKHYIFSDLEFWAEEGTICIMDRQNGEITAATTRDFAKRAEAINVEAKRVTIPDEKRALQECVLSMYAVWKEAKTQGDPTDPQVLRQKVKERKRAILVTAW